jgi:hypothetical protein
MKKRSLIPFQSGLRMTEESLFRPKRSHNGRDKSMRLLSVFLLTFPLLTFVAGQTTGDSQPVGSHGLRNKQYQLFLRPRDASNKDGEPIVLYPQQPWKCVAWKFEAQQGRVRLINYFTGKTFQLQSATGTHPVVQEPVNATAADAQGWKFVPVGDGLFKLESPNGQGVMTAIDADAHGDIRLWSGRGRTRTVRSGILFHCPIILRPDPL